MKNAWNGSLGETVRNEIATVYEGLPLDEPRFTIRHLVPEAFTLGVMEEILFGLEKTALIAFNSSKISLLDHKYWPLLEEKMMRLWQSIFVKMQPC